MSEMKPTSTAAPEASYALDNAWAQARQRLRAIEASYDPGTVRYLEACGVAPGWQCLEGGGGGTIVEWLCRRVGPTGHVVATSAERALLEHAGTDLMTCSEAQLLEDIVNQVFDTGN